MESVNIDWGSLGFGFLPTDCNVRSCFRDGRWSPLEFTSEQTINIHMAATSLHYGQEAFEGLKAFRCADGKIRIFRLEENAARLQASAEYLCMAPVPTEMFREAVVELVKRNERFVPPYGTGASLYIRPLLIGLGAQVGVGPAKEFMFLTFVTPVGPYFKEGFKPIKVIIDREHDRAAPLGTGHVKAGGNYGASMLAGELGHRRGYSNVLYLDAVHKRYIDECGAANFFAIRDGAYITPKSHSILPSITNKSLRVIAADMGLRVEERAVDVAELPTFEEAGACGTAAVISPIGSILDADNDTLYTFGDGKTPGPWSVKLYEELRGIQLGERDDRYGWNTVL